MSEDIEQTFDCILLPHNTKLYQAFQLKLATWDDIISTIKNNEDYMKRPYFIISDPNGRLFNAIPIVVDTAYNVLFQLTYIRDDKNNFWWDPIGIDNARYSTNLYDRNKFIVSKKIHNHTQFVDAGTSEIICFKKDKWQRKIYLGIETYPFTNGNNDMVYDFYIQPNNIDIEQLPESIQDLYAELYNNYLELINDNNNINNMPDELPVEKSNITMVIKDFEQAIPVDEPIVKESEQAVPVDEPIEKESEQQAVPVEKPIEKESEQTKKDVEPIVQESEQAVPVDESIVKESEQAAPDAEPIIKESEQVVSVEESIEKESEQAVPVVDPIVKEPEQVKQAEEQNEQFVKESDQAVSIIKESEQVKQTEEHNEQFAGQVVENKEDHPVNVENKELDIDINQYINDDIIEDDIENDEYVRDKDIVYYNQTLDDIPITQDQMDTDSVVTVNFPQIATDKLQKFDMESMMVSTGETYNPAYQPEYKPNTIIYPTHIPELNWLNDHSEHSISMDNMEFPTVSHYYNYMKFIFGLKESEINKDILSFAYKKIINTKSIKMVKQMTCEKGDLRHFMKYFDSHEWDKKKDNILFYGRLFKIKQHPELQAELLKLRDKEIYRIVKNVGNIPKNKLNRVLGPDIYWDATESKWYGGNGKDQWNNILNIVQNGNLSGVIEA